MSIFHNLNYLENITSYPDNFTRQFQIRIYMYIWDEWKAKNLWINSYQTKSQIVLIFDGHPFDKMLIVSRKRAFITCLTPNLFYFLRKKTISILVFFVFCLLLTKLVQLTPQKKRTHVFVYNNNLQFVQEYIIVCYPHIAAAYKNKNKITVFQKPEKWQYLDLLTFALSFMKEIVN